MPAADRRTVLKGAAFTCAAGLLGGCGAGPQEAGAPAPPASTGSPGGGGGGLRASLVQLSEVPVGGAVSVSSPDGKNVLVARLSENEAVAFSAVCPHEGCSVAPDDGQFTCPCHGSQFELSGEVKRGPAQSGLTPFEVRVVDGQVLPA